MSLKSINNILSVLETQSNLQEQPFQQLLKCWAEIVGAAVAAHTQPLSVQRDVLRVATSSAAWSQNLTFERKRLLLKLNDKLSLSLVDIHFSTAGWQSPKDKLAKEPIISPREHPSYVGGADSSCKLTSTALDANATFQDWAKRVQARSHSLPLCPACHCPTPLGELRRWQVCSICAAKQF
ncbi:RNA-binding protein [Scytonema hofmannii PCC 7110]|uniref:RNA-binding protein n=1 Tax=Scytonema hofmannii PCC 7110 TaxID=128403 RepID=A0A139XGS9_9CYAN|nr:DciA family protein [Scytonema hofmannii]KYC43897.1 RNA-binding protein [Scytonema hofmannii PCC 7110]